MRTMLKKHLYAREIEQKDLCRILGRSQTYITQRINGKQPWTIDEIYAICDFSGIPYTSIPEYFPKKTAA